MGRVQRDFYRRECTERTWMIENTWCGHCRLPDLGIDDPREFEEDGCIYLEGVCRICGRTLTSEVVDQRESA
ncbi:MAG: hypothetical protein GY733_00755 [bacterium]|nr:hypothetical protein [bacterium]